jgi:hypothetical protein
MILIGEQPYVGRLMLTMRDTRKFFAERLAISRHGRLVSRAPAISRRASASSTVVSSSVTWCLKEHEQ